jgi:hypothetical protein
MRLTYTNAAFTYYGVSMPGVPVLLDDEMVIIEGPQRWLFFISRRPTSDLCATFGVVAAQAERTGCAHERTESY